MPDSTVCRLRGRPSARFSPDAVLTGPQIRAARALLAWNMVRLAEEAGIGIATAQRAEASPGIPAIQMHTLTIIQATLERAGVRFINYADKIGVYLIQ